MIAPEEHHVEKSHVGLLDAIHHLTLSTICPLQIAPVMRGAKVEQARKKGVMT